MVKFVAAIVCAFFLVDVIGRKRSLSIGITLQTVSMMYVAAFLTAVPQLSEGEQFTSSQQHAATGAIVARGAPCADNAGTVLDAMDCVFARVITLVVALTHSSAPLATAKRPHALTLRPRDRVGDVAQSLAESKRRRKREPPKELDRSAKRVELDVRA